MYECTGGYNELSSNEHIFYAAVKALTCAVFVPVSKLGNIRSNSTVPEGDELNEQSKEYGYSKAEVEPCAVKSRKTRNRVYISCYQRRQQKSEYRTDGHAYKRGAAARPCRADKADIQEQERDKENNCRNTQIRQYLFHSSPHFQTEKPPNSNKLSGGEVTRGTTPIYRAKHGLEEL